MGTHRAEYSQFFNAEGYRGHTIRGQDPHKLFEESVVSRIVDSLYYKEQCFGLNAKTLCDRAVALTYVGGTYDAGRRASPFLCLALKMLELNLEPEVVDAYIGEDGEGGEYFKYLRALAAFYVRLTAERSEDVYKRLEPLLADYRKIRRRGNNGFVVSTIDQFVDDLLVKDRVCATSFWKIVPRPQLEDEDKLEEYVSPVAHMLESDGEDGSEGGEDEGLNGNGREESGDEDSEGE